MTEDDEELQEAIRRSIIDFENGGYSHEGSYVTDGGGEKRPCLSHFQFGETRKH